MQGLSKEESSVGKMSWTWMDTDDIAYRVFITES